VDQSAQAVLAVAFKVICSGCASNGINTIVKNAFPALKMFKSNYFIRTIRFLAISVSPVW
jgi:hypothetical protein